MERTAAGSLAGRICNIQGYTIHDGPGIRTEIFVSGCPLRCPWCSNPETQGAAPQLGVYPTKCLTESVCGWCKKACPEEGMLRFDAEGKTAGIRTAARCADCLACADACPADAIKVWGRKMTVPELMKVIEKDRHYYEKTGGGVTVSGGEIMTQWEFVAELLRSCKEAGIHTCAESALHCPQEHMEAVLRYTDLLIADIKHMDTEVHRRLTGAGNERILSNLRRAAELGLPMVVRTPVVMGYNDSEENLRATGRFILDELKGRVIRYQLLPYRKMGTEKYEALRRPYPMGDYVPPERSVWEPRLRELCAMLREMGVPADAGSANKLTVGG